MSNSERPDNIVELYLRFLDRVFDWVNEQIGFLSVIFALCPVLLVVMMFVTKPWQIGICVVGGIVFGSFAVSFALDWRQGDIHIYNKTKWHLEKRSKERESLQRDQNQE